MGKGGGGGLVNDLDCGRNRKNNVSNNFDTDYNLMILN